jgi:oligopeptide/dipeptide ABC transporter ATP-binding protein
MSREQHAQAVGGTVLEIMDLSKHFTRRGGIFSSDLAPVRAVDGVSFSVQDREALGIVGESGCGKSTVGLLLMRLLDPTGGRIFFEGKDITRLNRRAMRPLRRRLQMVFQDPYSSLSPRMTVRQILSEPLVIQGIRGQSEIVETVEQTLRTVGLRSGFLERYPHEFSGGQRQRIGIARALIGNPRLIIADEAVSALDVSIQAQILNLLAELRDTLHLSLIFISHNISVVQHLCDRIAVMYLGKIVEIGEADHVVMTPLHPYTEALLSAVPSPHVHDARRKRIVLKGDIPSATAPPSGCRFHTRCLYQRDLCKKVEPDLRAIGSQEVACHFAEEIFPANGGERPAATAGGTVGPSLS